MSYRSENPEYVVIRPRSRSVARPRSSRYHVQLDVASQPNGSKEIVPLRSIPVLSESLDSTTNPYKIRSRRGLDSPQDRLFGQEAYVRFDRRPTLDEMEDKLIEMRPRFQKGLDERIAANSAFRNKKSKDKINGLRYGTDMAVSTSLRSAKTKAETKQERQQDEADLHKHVLLARPLAIDVERWNLHREGRDHQYNLRCAEYGSLDQHQRRHRGRGPTGIRHRRLSYTDGRDKQLRDMFHDRDEVSICLEAREPRNPRESPYVKACDPQRDSLSSLKSTIGCYQSLMDHHTITDGVTAREKLHATLRKEDIRRGYDRYS